MSAAPDETEDEWDDLLPDNLKPKGKAVPLVRTPKQQAAAVKAAEERAQAVELAQAKTAQQAQAARLAQIVNLHIGGYSLADIGASIGATEAEVDRMLANETQRYVRNQPALRTYVRNFISGKYSELLEAVWDGAVDPTHKEQLERFDRAQRVLAQMGRLHGAEAPTQTEIKVDAAPEAVERLVKALSTGAGLGYDTDIFDVEVVEDMTADVHEAVEQAHKALEVSGNAVEESDGHDEL